MKPYSQDLRDRVIAALKADEMSQVQIAAVFGVSLTTVETWWRRWRRTGSCAATPHKGGRPRALSGCEATIRAALAEQPDATLQELCDRVAELEDVEASPGMMCRELQRLRLPRKKGRSMTASAIRRGCRPCARTSASGSSRVSGRWSSGSTSSTSSASTSA